ncbi:acyl-[acyl-carrier-protein] thioesterase [Desulfosporosinus fructosivorans]
MQSQKYRMEFVVHYHEVNPEEQATPLTLLYYLEDAAIAHSESVGYGLAQVKDEGLAWILNRWHLQMDRYPILGEKVTIETWPSSFERFYGRREFLIWNMNQEIIGRATSLWIFYNIVTKRPSRIRSEFGEAYGLDPVRAIDDPFAPLQAIGIGAGEAEQEFSVRRSDIDTNGHVNNASYLQWMIEVVPEDTYQKSKLSSLEIQYKKETTYGSSISSKCLREGLDRLQSVCRHVILAEDSGQELAIAKTVWVGR